VGDTRSRATQGALVSHPEGRPCRSFLYRGRDGRQTRAEITPMKSKNLTFTRG
jgi:hypothetical protein